MSITIFIMKYFYDVYKHKRLGDIEVQVEAIYDKNGKELYNGAKAILDVPYGDGFEVGKVVVYENVDTVHHEYYYTYGFKPKKGAMLWIEEDGSNIELI